MLYITLHHNDANNEEWVGDEDEEAGVALSQPCISHLRSSTDVMDAACG